MAESAESNLLAKIVASRAHAIATGWDDVVVELDQAEHLVQIADGLQAQRHIETAARMLRDYEGVN